MPNTDKKILLIEDDDIVRDSMALFLEDGGFNVVAANDGEIGLAMVLTEYPDLVISDLKMPNLGGMSVLEALNEQNPELPVIIMSGAGGVDDAVKALRLGAHDYFVKPIGDLDMLELSIERAFENTQLKRENRKYKCELEKTNKALKQSLYDVERDQKAAFQVQQSMLPPNRHQLGSTHIEYLFRPSHYLSGDFIDYLYVHKRFLVFYLADVAGHGAPSAFVTVFLKNLTSSMFREYEYSSLSRKRFRSPANMLANMNERLIEADLDKHATIFLGILDQQTNKIHYAVGGHMPMPVHKRIEGSARYLQGDGLPIGLLSEAKWQDCTIQMTEGDRLLLSSDGVLEVMPSSSLLQKEQGWLDLVSNSNDLDEITNKLGLKGILPDDLAVMCLRIGAKKHG